MIAHKLLARAATGAIAIRFAVRLPVIIRRRVWGRVSGSPDSQLQFKLIGLRESDVLAIVEEGGWRESMMGADEYPQLLQDRENNKRVVGSNTIERTGASPSET